MAYAASNFNDSLAERILDPASVSSPEWKAAAREHLGPSRVILLEHAYRKRDRDEREEQERINDYFKISTKLSPQDFAELQQQEKLGQEAARREEARRLAAPLIIVDLVPKTKLAIFKRSLREFESRYPQESKTRRSTFF
jgi:hypothetical protein